MNLLVDRASARDLIEAEALMREVLESDLGGYVPKWHADLDDLAAAYFDDPKRSLFIARVAGEARGHRCGQALLFAHAAQPGMAGRSVQRPVGV